MKVDVYSVIADVARLRRINPASAISKSRSQRLTNVRFVAYLYCHDILLMSFTNIAKSVGGHHTTISYGIQKARNLVRIDPSWRFDWEVMTDKSQYVNWNM